jgi:hypothetical protein
MSAPIPSNNRTKVGNGLRWFPRPKDGGPDMRLPEGRRLAELCADLIEELGRRPTVSELTQIKLAARIAINVETEDLDRDTLRALSAEHRCIRRDLGLADGNGAEQPGPSLRDLLAGNR